MGEMAEYSLDDLEMEFMRDFRCLHCGNSIEDDPGCDCFDENQNIKPGTKPLEAFTDFLKSRYFGFMEGK